jgi:hypothetical protein
MALNTFPKASTAVGVYIIVVAGTASPLIAKARDIASTVPPVGIAILAPKVILKRALH